MARFNTQYGRENPRDNPNADGHSVSFFVLFYVSIFPSTTSRKGFHSYSASEGGFQPTYEGCNSHTMATFLDGELHTPLALKIYLLCTGAKAHDLRRVAATAPQTQQLLFANQCLVIVDDGFRGLP
jgi:hypothetical protein